jgi:hypothetical protein
MIPRLRPTVRQLPPLRPAPAPGPRQRWALPALAAALGAVVATLLLLPAAPASAAGTTINVNPAAGNDNSSGSALRPLRTLAKALSKAGAGDTIQLAGGIYSQNLNGERYSTINGEQTVVVPSGVAIRGNAGPGVSTILAGAENQVGLLLKGTATISEISTVGFGVGLQAAQGSQTLSGLQFLGGGIRLTGTANASLSGEVHLNLPFTVGRGQTIFRQLKGAAVSVNDQARFAMIGGNMLGRGPTGDATANCDTSQKGIFASGSARVTLQHVRIDDLAGGALELTGLSTASMTGSRIVADYTDGCVPRPSVLTSGSTPLTVEDSGLQSNQVGSISQADAIRSLSAGSLVVKNTRITGYRGDGIEAGTNATLVDVRGSTLFNSRDINAREATRASISVRDSTLGGDPGVVAHSLKLRNSNVSNSNRGIVITGPSADLGTVADPGLNVFRDNGLTSVQFDPGVATGRISAVGNVWEPLQQGSNAFGFYPSSVTVSGKALGRNFTLHNPAQSIELGPFVGRLRLAPQHLRARAGKTARLGLSWTHPQSWKRLRKVELRLHRGARTVGRVAIHPHAERVTATGAIELERRASRLAHQGKTVTAKLGLRFSPELAGRTLRVAVLASDRHGHRQLRKRAGTVHVRR